MDDCIGLLVINVLALFNYIRQHKTQANQFAV